MLLEVLLTLRPHKGPAPAPDPVAAPTAPDPGPAAPDPGDVPPPPDDPVVG